MKSRRDFLKSSALLGLAACAAPASEEGERRMGGVPSPVVGGDQERPDVLREPTGLKIRSLETFTSGFLSFVRVRTDDGSEGWGQISTYDADISAEVFHRKIAPLALDRDPADLSELVDRCIESNYKFPWSYVCRALCGLDTAVWDLLGKLNGKNVSEMLGGRVGTLPVYGSSMSRRISPVDEAERLKELRDSLGFSAFKVRVGKVNGRDQDEWPGRTEELIPTVRKAVGDEVALLVDGNSCYTPGGAIEVGRKLEDNGYVHFEEPCPYWELEWTAAVAAELDMDVAGGEQDNDLAQWRRMIGMRAVDVVQPDICYVGGLTRALRVAAMAEKAGLKCVPHSANLSLVTVFTLALFAAIPNRGNYIEFSIEEDQWAQNLYDPALQIVDGRVQMPSDPGWGVTIRPDWLERSERRKSEVEA